MEEEKTQEKLIKVKQEDLLYKTFSKEEELDSMMEMCRE